MNRAVIVLIAALSCGLVGVAALIGFSSRGAPRATRPPRPPVTRPVPTTTPPSLVAALATTTAAYRSPGGPKAAPISPRYYGAPLVVPVIATRGGDLEVRLPTRPNGSTTWVRRTSVRVYATPYRIVVDLGTRHVLLYDNGKLILDAPAGVGTVADPTPTGHFFVAFFAKAPTPAWGPFVMVTSAHSNTITDWEESGDAVVAIHGPLGEGAQIGPGGAQISHGCVRLHDRDLAALRNVPDGSPVDIIA